MTLSPTTPTQARGFAIIFITFIIDSQGIACQRKVFAILKMMNHLIRPFNHTDVEDIKACLVELQDFERLMDPHRLAGLQVAHDYLQHLLDLCNNEKGMIFVAEKNHSIVGMISVYIEDDHKHFRKMRTFAHIADLIVMKEHKDEGIIKELLEKAEEYAKSKHISSIQATILHSHSEGLAGYLRNGFHEHEVVVRKRV